MDDATDFGAEPEHATLHQAVREFLKTVSHAFLYWLMNRFGCLGFPGRSDQPEFLQKVLLVLLCCYFQPVKPMVASEDS